MAIKQIDIIHLTHTDYGYTDHQVVCRENRIDCIEKAVELAMKYRNYPVDARFRWTCEGTDAVLDWWNRSDEKKRNLFLKLIKDGYIEVMGLPFNQNGHACREEWEKMTNWLPESLREKLSIKVAMQSDINGFPRAGAIAVYDKGIRYIYLGTNGGSIHNKNWFFRWEIEKRKQVGVWNVRGYSGNFYWLLHEKDWRMGPLPKSADTKYRPPHTGDYYRTDAKSIEMSHKFLNERMKLTDHSDSKYPFDTLLLCETSKWRGDNDPPNGMLCEFIREWNRRGFAPKLRFTTPYVSIKQIEKEAEEKGLVKTFKGEWTDWWVNGAAATPRDLSAGRKTRIFLRAIDSEIFRKDAKTEKKLDECWRDLCLFSEHTCGYGYCTGLPYHPDTIGEFAEKSCYAFRPLARSEKILADLVKDKLKNKDRGIYVINPFQESYTGWIELPANCLRGEYKAIKNTKTSEVQNFVFEKGFDFFNKWGQPLDKNKVSPLNYTHVFEDIVPDKLIKFWIKELKSGEIRKCELLEKSAKQEKIQEGRVNISTDKHNWPVSLKWDGIGEQILNGQIAHFISLEAKEPWPRCKFDPVYGGYKADKLEERMKLRKRDFVIREAVEDGSAEMKETDHTLVFEQTLKHPKLKFLYRKIEIYKNLPRADIKVRLYRLSDPKSAEVYYLRFDFPFKGLKPCLSNGGKVFRLGCEQIPATCKDFYAIDSWVSYPSEKGSVVWNGNDSGLVTFGQPNDGLRIEKVPENSEKLLAIVYNNLWFTNFLGDCAGEMEYNFVVEWKPKLYSDKSFRKTHQWATGVAGDIPVKVIV